MPYWRLSSFYLCYFGALGILVPYWGLYLKALTFDAAAIGQLTAVLMATKFFAPYVWGWLGDHLGHRMRIVRFGSLMTALCFIGVFYYRGFWSLAVVTILFSFFWNAVLPQVEVVTLRYLGTDAPRYARIRVWGSIGFILMVMLFGVAVDRYGPTIILPAMLLVYGTLWLTTLTIRDPDPVAQVQGQGHILRVLGRPTVIAFLLASFLMQIGHGAYYAFYSIYMEQMGHSKTLIGQLWALGVMAEVVVFLFMHRLLSGLGARRLLLASFAIAALRWSLIGLLPGSIALMLLAQLLHAATFGVFHAAAIHLVHQLFVGRHQGRGQALYSSISFGGGGALGSLVAGMVWDSSGPLLAFLLCALVSLLAWVIAWRWVEEPDGSSATPAGPLGMEID